MNKFWIFACFLILLGLTHLPVSHTLPTGSEDGLDYNDDEDGNNSSDEDDEGNDEKDAKLFSTPMVIEADVGGEFELFCLGDSNGAVVIWAKESPSGGSETNLFVDNQALSGDSRFQLDYTPGRSNLILKNVSASDAGKYKCSYSTGAGQHVIHTVHVRVAPRVEISGETRVFRNGEPATLSCQVTGYPKPRVYWERKNHKRMPTGELKIEANEITFDAVTRHHAGIYECFAENSAGSARAAVNVQVLFPPEIEVEKESVHTGEGLEVELECFVHAEPKAQVVWYKDGIEVVSSRHESVVKNRHHYVLHLKDVTDADFGNYDCVATNQYGRSNKSINLSGAPSQPGIVDGTGVAKNDPTGYTLVWKLESSIKAENFKLKYRKVDDEDWIEERAMGSETQTFIYTVSHTLRNLEPNVPYEATLTAANEYGTSKESRPYKFQVTGKDYQSQEAEKDASNARADESKGTAGSAGRNSMSAFIALFLTILSTHLLRC